MTRKVDCKRNKYYYLNMKLKRGQRYPDWKERCEKFPEYYHKQHPEWTEEQCKKAATYFCRSINWQCPEFYKKDNPELTDEECYKMIDERKRKQKESHKFHIEYYQKRYPNATPEEWQKMISEYSEENNYQNIKYYQKRYPNATPEEWQKMLSEAKQHYLSIRKDNSGVNNPAHHSKTTELQRKQRSPMCIEFYQLKYPNLSSEEQHQMLLKHKEMIKEKMSDKTRQVRCIEYWMAKGYSEEESRKIISEQQKTFTLEKCIKKYGAEEGTKRFNERQIKWQKSLHNALKNNETNGKTQSGFASSIIKVINDFYDGEQEFQLDRYSYDYRYKDKLIEFNGDYWHMNPTIFLKNDINKTTGFTAEQIWNKDIDKKRIAELNNYKILIIWESEYRKDVSSVIKKCLDFLHE